MKRFYVGDGQYGFRRWLYARVLWTWWKGCPSVDLPYGWSWNVTVDGRQLYARKWR